ncbi:MAG: hypothetical protein ABSF91_09825 [Bacteroidota bacterium]
MEFFVSLGSPLASETPDVKTAMQAAVVVAPLDQDTIVEISLAEEGPLLRRH